MLLSEIKDDNDWFRLDSHYYEKHYVKLKEKLSNMPHWFLKDIVSKPIQTGHTPSMKKDAYYGGQIALIKTDNLHANHISETFSDFLSEEGNSTIARTSLQESDIITTIIGATEDVIARSAMVSKEYLPANINQNIVQIRINKDIALPEYVNTYLNTQYGRDYLRYLSRQTEQVNLNCQEVGMTIVPMFSSAFQNEIKKYTIKAKMLQKASKEFFKNARKILEAALHMADFTPSVQNISVCSLVDSLLSSGRLDAEYYQPQYEQYTYLLHTNDTVNTLCNIHDKNYVPVADKEYLYIELSNVDLEGSISDVEKMIGMDLPSRARRKVNKGQVIISSVEGSLQSCALITDEFNGALCSTGFYVLTSKYINPETLLVLFKSEPIQALMKQRCSGTILTAITKDELLSMPLPKVDDAVQKKIAFQVQESFALRQQSEQLLEYAKRGVEIAVEQDEKTALEWLKEKGVEG